MMKEKQTLVPIRKTFSEQKGLPVSVARVLSPHVPLPKESH